MKNTSVFLSAALAFGFAGCTPASGPPRVATPVLLEGDVKVQVDSEGRPQVGAGQAANVEAVKAH